MRRPRLGRALSREVSEAGCLRDDDDVLVAAARLDPVAFAPLYGRYFDPVYRYCIRRLGHPEEAADATAQVFVKVLAGLPRYRGDGKSFRSWLFAIAHNELVNAHRGRTVTVAIEEARYVIEPSPLTEEQVLTAETGRTIRSLLAQLPNDQREVMELRLAGLTAVEIASTVGRSPGSVKIAQHRAINQLRSVMDLVDHLRRRRTVPSMITIKVRISMTYSMLVPWGWMVHSMKRFGNDRRGAPHLRNGRCAGTANWSCQSCMGELDEQLTIDRNPDSSRTLGYPISLERVG